MKDLMFFDACCRVGNCTEGPRPGITELLKDMDRFGVDRALVQHNAAGAMEPAAGNRKFSEMLKKEDPEQRLTCVWHILPGQCGELPEPEEFFASMKENRAGAIALDPVNHRFSAKRPAIGKYMDEAAKRRVPVVLSFLAGKWDELYDFLKEFPDICCIIHGGDKWGRDRFLRPLFETYPGVHMEISGYWTPEGIADLAKIYGAERLLYSSGFPRYNHGAAMLQVKHSGLDDREVALIAGKNLENMLEAALW